MWLEKKNRSAVPLNSDHEATPPAPRQEISMSETTTMKVQSPMSSSAPQTVLGQTVVLRGELSANENLAIEGQFEGTISLEEHCLTVGSGGQVKADVRAGQVVILGTITGKVVAREKVEIRRSGRLMGDLVAGAVAVEEGAYFKGSIDILREEAQQGSRSLALRGEGTLETDT
jgi:cytoskeletal protein CcmA (bactofilin family)